MGVLMAGTSSDQHRQIGLHWAYDNEFSLGGSTSGCSIWASPDGLVVLHYNTIINHGEYPPPTSYYSAPTITSFGPNPRHIFGIDRSNHWVANDTGLYVWNSGTTSYDATSLTYSSSGKVRGVAFATDDIWLMTDSELWHWNGTSWADLASGVPSPTVNFVSLRRADSSLFLLGNNGADSYVYEYSGGSWGSAIFTKPGELFQEFWTTGSDDIWLGLGQYQQIKGVHWNGSGFDTSAYATSTKDLYQTYTIRDACWHANSPGHVAFGYGGPTGKGGVMEFHRNSADGRVQAREGSLSTHQFWSITEVGNDHIAANIRDGDVDAYGRMLIGERRVRDLLLINPSAEIAFGSGGNGFTGNSYDGAFYLEGVKSTPEDLSFGTVADGLNTRAWHDFGNGVLPLAARPAPANWTWDVSIPSNGVVSLHATQLSTGSAVSTSLGPSGLWTIPAGDFEMIVDCEAPVNNYNVTQFGLVIVFVHPQDVSGALSFTDVDIPAGASNNYCRVIAYYAYWSGNTEIKTNNFLEGVEQNSPSSTIWSGIHVPSQFKISRVGDQVTLGAKHPVSGTWTQATSTLGNGLAGSNQYNFVADGPCLPQLEFYASGGSVGKETDVRFSNFQLTPPVSVARGLRNDMPYSPQQREADALSVNASMLIVESTGASFIDIVNSEMMWKLSGDLLTESLFPQLIKDGAGTFNWMTDRIAYHEGLWAIIAKDWGLTWSRGLARVPRILFGDFSSGQLRKLVPGDDSSDGDSGSLYMGSAPDKMQAGALDPQGLISTPMRDRIQVGSDNWKDFDTASNSEPWRCADGDPRGIAVFRDAYNYCYLCVATTEGLSVHLHRPYYEYGGNIYDTNGAHNTTYGSEVLAVTIDKSNGSMFWISAAGVLYYATKATWQALGSATPDATYYLNGFGHDASTAFSGTWSQRSQEKIYSIGNTIYLCADEGVYRSVAGASFELLYGVSGSGALYEILPTGTTSVDAVSADSSTLAAMSYNSSTGKTFLSVINLTSNTVSQLSEATDALGGSYKRATCVSVLEAD